MKYDFLGYELKLPMDFVMDKRLQEKEMNDSKWVCISVYDLEDVKNKVLDLEDQISEYKHQIVDLESEIQELERKLEEFSGD